MQNNTLCPVDDCPGCKRHAHVHPECSICSGEEKALNPNPSARVLNVVTHLNDYHRWPREAIADWVQHLLYPETLAEPLEIADAPVGVPLIEYPVETV